MVTATANRNIYKHFKIAMSDSRLSVQIHISGRKKSSHSFIVTVLVIHALQTLVKEFKGLKKKKKKFRQGKSINREQ